MSRSMVLWPAWLYKKGAGFREPAPLYFWWRRGRVELPVQEKLPRICYKLSQLFDLTRQTSADRVSAGPVDISFAALIDMTAAAPQLFDIHSQPVEVGSGWMCCRLVRQQKRIHVRQLYFCHLFNEVDGASACNPAAYLPCRTRASPCAADETVTTSFVFSSPGLVPCPSLGGR